MTLTVQLSGHNFVSEKTKAAFEKALQDGHCVETVADEPEQAAAPSMLPVPSAAGPASTVQAPRSPAPRPETHSVTKHALNYQRVLESLERGLAQSFDHQSLTLHVHERYLDNQAEYTKVFYQLLQQQIALSSNGNETPHQAESTAAMLEHLERSMTRFHDHQTETLSVHERHLKNQAGFSETSIQLLQQQYALLTNDHVPPRNVELSPAVPAAKDLFPVAPVARPQVGIPIPAPTQVAPVVVPNPSPTSLPGTVSGTDLEALSKALLEVVSEKTGYPAEMLELDMDMEADLGIDSIKRVEILGTVQSLYPDLPQVNPEELAELRTLGQITDHVGASLQAGQTVLAPVVPDNGTGSSSSASLQEVSQPGLADFEALSGALLEVVSEKTGYPAEMLELDMDMEADLGIDSIKRVEILGTVQSLYPDLPQVNPEELAELRTLGQITDHMGASLQAGQTVLTPVVQNDGTDSPPSASLQEVSLPGLADVETLSGVLLEVVSEKTGYPAEMLELDMDMEADLGIDSIKRVEILGTVQSLYPDLPQVNPEELAELRTLGQITDHMSQQMPATIKKKCSTDGQEPALNHSIKRSLVKLKLLPAPDFLEFTMPANHICLITDDGTPTSIELAQALVEQGWQVVLLSFPPSVLPVVTERHPEPATEGHPLADLKSSGGISHIFLQDMSEDHLKQKLATVLNSHGSVGVFIHLNPTRMVRTYEGEGLFESERAVIKHVFLMAKHLKRSLAEAARIGRACFLTVTRLDGEFGLGDATDFGVISGGLFGLAKTLNLEWERVFCRAIDLSPDLDPGQSAQTIVAELHDPNRLIVEVGHSLQGRTTLVCE